ncbi:MAG TPA: methyltransferase domain-containing protein [Ktedonobacteraceae bacterium]|nr:methyltransferase domain-containing protein [Ktedonobacteraceae bacterium]
METSLNRSSGQLARRHGEYGFDEPVWPLLFGLLGVIFLVLGFLSFWMFDIPVLGVIWLVCAILFLFTAASYVYTTRRGKFQVWAEILLQLGLRGDEQIIDLGCGRGAVLLMAANLLPRGKATGIDVWKANEQSGNALSVTQQNAQREGVAGSVALHTADMQQLPFPDGSFDLVVSSLAIHNIRKSEGRKQALREAARVLKPGGRLVIADFFTRRYEECLREFGMTDVTLHAFDWRFWYGGPWAVPRLVSARKPS